ncbi:WYL domain-containing protein [Marihabitans asiaticum]|uniref:Proteasome accessory factor C n=1 Tax=Marihabitans asiaticum TaxID=415218 RepID=A0A560W6H9_9MICO|nr:WYL domain-containing protein [Marihabitans asiaticum]TWD13227.1 proteasome accessory factor C [Marihabitans asiaticum]
MSPRPPAEPATTRVKRLLTMVPWLVSRQGIDLAEAAAGLGVTESQLTDDLDLLFMCGYGPMTDELIDVSYEAGRVFVDNADAISRPLRLGVDEAVTVIVGLRALAASGAAPSDAVERALTKVEQACAAVSGIERVVVIPDHADAEGKDLLQSASSAVQERRRVHLSYLVPSRDERTERDVDPMRVVALDGHWYLEGWCHRARDTRLFRLDRIEALSVLDEDGTPPEGARSRDLSSGAYPSDVGHDAVTLRLRPAARWVAEYYPVQELREDGEDLVVTLAARDEDWLARLVLRGGGEIGIEAPASAAEAVMARAQAALGEYTG